MGFLVHLNGHLLCAVDIETTGLDPKKHDIIQVCVLPLDSQIRPIVDGSIKPFYTCLQPKHPENIDPQAMYRHGIDISTIMNTGLDPWKAAEMFEEWFNGLGLAERKKIAPLGQCYVFDRGFLIEWLGHLTYEYCFDYHIRDTASCALFMNDKSSFKIDSQPPFPKINLQYLASQLGVKTERLHDAMQDCLTTAAVYRAMLLTDQSGI
jgi:DNA polymerase III epsilon subunit-like protein